MEKQRCTLMESGKARYFRKAQGNLNLHVILRTLENRWYMFRQSSGYLIAKHEDERKNEACIRFLKYILSEETQEKLAVESDQAPENPMLDSERLYEENPLLGKALEKANTADIQIISLSTEWGSQAANILNTFLNGNSIDLEKTEILKEKLLELSTEN